MREIKTALRSEIKQGPAPNEASFGVQRFGAPATSAAIAASKAV